MRNKFALKMIRAYQEGNPNRPPRCRYYPSCSNYAKGCYEKFNFVKASLLTLWRLIRCNPFHKCGYDPVPLTRKEKKEMFIDIEDIEKSTENE